MNINALNFVLINLSLWSYTTGLACQYWRKPQFTSKKQFVEDLRHRSTDVVDLSRSMSQSLRMTCQIHSVIPEPFFFFSFNFILLFFLFLTHQAFAICIHNLFYVSICLFRVFPKRLICGGTSTRAKSLATVNDILIVNDIIASTLPIHLYLKYTNETSIMNKRQDIMKKLTFQ